MLRNVDVFIGVLPDFRSFDVEVEVNNRIKQWSDIDTLLSQAFEM